MKSNGGTLIHIACLLQLPAKHMDRLKRHSHTATELQQALTLTTNHFTFSPFYKSALSDCGDFTEYV